MTKQDYIRWGFIFLGLLGVYALTRLIALTQIPIFTDEAIYIRWAQIGGNDAGWRFISLTDGKQPLFTWMIMVWLRVFHDPLVAGRVASVIGGAVGMIGMFALGSELFKNKKIGLIASILYIISPFTLMHDRLAIYDTWVAALYVWNAWLAVLLVRHKRLDIALIYGMALGTGMINKTSGFISLYAAPFTILLGGWRKSDWMKKMGTWVAWLMVAALLSQVMYSILRLSPFFYIIKQKDALFVYPLTEWVAHPLTYFWGNIRGMSDWLIGYMTIPIFIAALASFIIKPARFLEKSVMIIYWLAPFVGLAMFGRVLYPRFILFMTMPLYILTAYTVYEIYTQIKNIWIKWGIIVLICFQSVIICGQVLKDARYASIPRSDSNQYINDWPAGWGVKEIVSYLNEASKSEKVTVYTEGTFGLFPFALEMYAVDNPNITIQSMWPVPSIMPQFVKDSSVSNPTFFITSQRQDKPSAWNLELIEEFQQGKNPSTKMRFYKVRPTTD